jgi:nitrile hydratase
LSAPPAVAPLPFPPPYADPAAAPPRFASGDVVRVRRGAGPGHIRTPAYLRGATGRVERVCGHFSHPERLAYMLPPGPPAPLYRVRFALVALWGAEAGFAVGDTLDAEIYENWLEPVDAA